MNKVWIGQCLERSAFRRFCSYMWMRVFTHFPQGGITRCQIALSLNFNLFWKIIGQILMKGRQKKLEVLYAGVNRLVFFVLHLLLTILTSTNLCYINKFMTKHQRKPNCKMNLLLFSLQLLEVHICWSFTKYIGPFNCVEYIVLFD